MKTFLRRLILISMILRGIPCAVSGQETPSPSPAMEEDKAVVYLIPVRQEIMQPQLFLLRRGVKRALQAEADAIVLLMDTPGGRVDIMKEMTSMVIDLDIPTYTLVEGPEHGAISAGAILAMATDKIYMQPGTLIGDAMPVIAGPNGYESLGDAEREKIETYMDAVVRSIAQAKGRNEMLIRAMVRQDLEYVLEDGTVISPAGQILTMTSQEAERVLPDGSRLLSEGTVENLNEMLETVGLGDAERIELVPEAADTLALWITRLAPMLLSIAGLLVYLEFQSPGIGWAGGSAVLLFLVVVFGHNIAGLAGMEDMVIILLGVVLILVEVFILPGFGIAGISGLALLLAGLIKAMSVRFPGNPGELPAFDNFGNLGNAFTNVSIAIIFGAVLAVLFMRSLGETRLLGKTLVLNTDIQPSSRDTSALTLASLVGETARALTPLRPAGTVEIGDRQYDAVSDGEYLESGIPLKVVDVRNHRVIVSRETEVS